jgi:hypothetical protein
VAVVTNICLEMVTDTCMNDDASLVDNPMQPSSVNDTQYHWDDWVV